MPAPISRSARQRYAWSLMILGAGLVVYLAYLHPDRGILLESYPREFVIPWEGWVTAALTWLRADFSWLTRIAADVIGVPLSFAFGLLATGFKLKVFGAAWTIPRLSWLGIALIMAQLGWIYGGWRLASLSGLGFLALAVFGVWDSAMRTLALIIICVAICAVTGLVVGVWAYKFPRFRRTCIMPLLDLMQTMPTFAYLIPMLLFFGSNYSSGLMATALFAIPPMVRATYLGLEKVPQDLADLADMCGCTKRQKLWFVMLPASKPSLMLGLNQVIMLALNMVIIASMIGAGGLGYDVNLALRSLNIGKAMEAGLAIVILAIVLDRLSQAVARRNARSTGRAGARQIRRQFPLALALAIGTTLLSIFVPALNKLPGSMTLTTAPYWKMAVDFVTRNFFDQIETVRVALLLNFLNPLRHAFEQLPWLGVLIALVAVAWRWGGVRLALATAGLVAFCASTGLWVPAMQTLYLAGAATLLACCLGFPIGVLASRSTAVERVVNPVIDTLQTIPTFCFIIPVVMLFRVGDVTALIATVSFAIVPAIRYVNHGIRQVPHHILEAAVACGCSKWQLFRSVQLPLALPEILLGINQTILLSLSMIVVCAMIGTRDLGQEVFKALATGDPGRGLVAGLVISIVGILSDRLLTAAIMRVRSRRGTR